MAITPDERARRALVRSMDVLTELVTITADPGDGDGNPKAFTYVPNELLSKTFKRVGLDEEQEIQAVKAGLMIQLPEIKQWLREKLKLKADVEISIVYDILRLRLAQAAKNGGGSA